MLGLPPILVAYLTMFLFAVMVLVLGFLNRTGE